MRTLPAILVSCALAMPACAASAEKVNAATPAAAAPAPAAVPVSTAPANSQPQAAPHAAPGDTFLTFGGGYNPSGNQVSLERNVLYFQRVLQKLGESQRPNTILFADGNDPMRDLQFFDPKRQPSETKALLAHILIGNVEGMTDSYRNHEIPGLSGPASISDVDQWFNSCAAKLTGTDRAFLYFTGHGSHAVGKNGAESKNGNTIMHLWAGQDLTVREFTKRLDKIPAEVPTVMVMVQCYSGGFANTIFEGGDSTNELSPRLRAGFFATVQDRTAAGCTPDINELNYQEYSSDFFAALSGFDRMGKAIEKPDYNHDGVVSFNEAHAYAVIHEITIDIPVKTSDAMLRKYSAYSAPGGKTVAGLLTTQSPYSQLLAAAGPCERAILEALSQQMNLSSDDRVAMVRKAAADLQKKLDEMQQVTEKAQKGLETIRPQLAEMLSMRWPELSHPWNAGVEDVLRNDSEEIMGTLRHHPRFARFEELMKKLDDTEKKSLDTEKEWAKHQRFLRTIENVALQANLPKLASPEIQKRYAALIALEAGTLGKS